MPWCPKCKTEYRKGITTCSDCGSTLVEDLNAKQETASMLLLMNGDSMHINMVADHLKAEGFTSILVKEKMNKNVNEEKGYVSSHEIYVSLKESEAAVKCAANFMRNTNPQAEELIKNPDSPRVIVAKGASGKEYVSANERGKDLKASGIMLLLFGIAGLVFMVLVILDVVPINFYGFNAVIAYTVMGVFFGALFIFGITSLLSAKKTKSENEEEKKQFEELDNWFENNLTKDIMEEKLGVGISDSEQAYFVRMDYMRQMLYEAFPGLNEDMAEYYLEKKYSEYFE